MTPKRLLAVWACALTVLAGGMVGFGNAAYAQAAPEVQAQEVEGALPPGPEADAGPEPAWPKLPPLDQVPPMPMPEPPEIGTESSGLLSTVLVHDALTGETLELGEEESISLQELMSAQGGGYAGVDGGLGTEVMPEGFGSMSQIFSTGTSPWRVNVKLLMRFVRTNGTDAWFVCSGSMQDAEVVLTAAHCVYNRDATINDWAAEIFVFPGWDGNGNIFPPQDPVQTYGWARGTYYGAGSNYINNGDWDADVGFIGVTRAVGMLTGWFGWAWGGSCATIQGRTYHNTSYPSENCPLAGLHNGADMYYWFGSVDACPNNQMQLNTGGGNCFDTVWGGMSGSGMYYIDGDSRYVHAVCSTSNRTTRGYYCRLWEGIVDFMNNTIIPNTRGAAFDLQALNLVAVPTTIAAGSQTTTLNHLATNPTNNNPAAANYTYRVYLSTNDIISSGDTLLSTQNINWDFGAMTSVRINMIQVTIPASTAPGTYWLGVLYDSGTDGNTSNNATNGWDAVRITVTCPSQGIPTNVQASDGTFTTVVQVTWTAPAGAANYSIYRNTVNNSGTASLIASNVVGTVYNDNGATPGVTYYYWVRARNACGNFSGYSATNTGWRALLAPGGVAATDGTFWTHVRITWGSVTGASHYQVYRNTVNNAGTSSAVSGWQTGTTFNDNTAAHGVIYFYWVRAAVDVAGTRASAYGGPDTGWRGYEPPFLNVAVSRKTHGAGTFDIDLLGPNNVEGRVNGPTLVLVRFDKLIQGVGGLDPTDVDVSSGTVTGVSIAGTVLTVSLTGVNNPGALAMKFPGIAEASQPTAIVQDILCFRTLVGDVNGDGNTNVLDLVVVRNNLNTVPTAATFRSDVNTDNTINVLDLVQIRNNLNKTAPPCL